MAIGTDKQMLGTERSIRKVGRPRVNRRLGYQLIKAGYSTRYICRVLSCKARTIRLMKQELRDKGEVNKSIEKTEEMDKLEAGFDQECERAVGISFYKWMKAKNKNHSYIFHFCRKVWEKTWGKPSLIMVRDRDNPLGDRICMKFLEVFGEDKKRLRNRKKNIRCIFRFLGRQDLNDRYLTMTKSRDPEPVREIPELTLVDFPKWIDVAVNIVHKRYGPEFSLALKLKIVTQMRTGDADEGRELFGLTKGVMKGSWIIMAGPDEFRGQIIGKSREKWILEWLPRDVRHDLWELYDRRMDGEKIFQMDKQELRDAWTEATASVEGLRTLTLHDLRKVGITWLWAMGIDLSIATELNVGWKDLNTAKKNYLRNTELLRRSERLAYRGNIPTWFKEGLDEYLPY